MSHGKVTTHDGDVMSADDTVASPYCKAIVSGWQREVTDGRVMSLEGLITSSEALVRRDLIRE